ncbi:transglutaminase family protein [uncultured Dysosmobacter sp.]|uniref:transglutaminase-like domain-containing protein n=1 Tax=uncultured Dysosmobacter sp. TaxID=2591384 RepID=UPI00262551D8|nr:transglutaminase-like domain-containing protein [uncultured Dysosmobacter sp.]
MYQAKIPALFLALCLLTGLGGFCQQARAAEAPPGLWPAATAQAVSSLLYLEDEPVPLAAAASTMLLPEASGTAVKKNNRAVIDYSNITDGYVMTRFTGSTNKRLKVQVIGPATTYNYDLTAGSWATFPLSDGNGSYKVTVVENTTGSKYALVLSVSFQVTLKDEFAPFLRPNQYVDYGSASKAVEKAAELTKDVTDPLVKVEKVYSFVVKNLTYDKDKAKTVKSGYLPVLDDVLAAKKGICFDYAALMTGMLRSQGVPCKLVVGYAGTAYHAWINVWTEASGWINGAIYFDGTTWKRMDPTFASSANSSESIMKYIGDGKNYTVKYLY